MVTGMAEGPKDRLDYPSGQALMANTGPNDRRAMVHHRTSAAEAGHAGGRPQDTLAGGRLGVRGRTLGPPASPQWPSAVPNGRRPSPNRDVRLYDLPGSG